MRSMAVRLIIGCALLALGTQTAAAQPVTILPLGDSITNGFASTNLGGYREPLYRRLESIGWRPEFVGSQSSGNFPEPAHEGHNGVTIRQLNNIANNLDHTNRGRMTLVMVGTNDIWHGTGPNSPANAPQNLDRLLESIFRNDEETQVFVASIPPIWNGHIYEELAAVREYNAAIPGIVAGWAARGKSIHFVDVYNSMTINDLADGVHPNDSGYQKIADAFFNSITAVPEPGSAAVFGIAAAACLLRRRGR